MEGVYFAFGIVAAELGLVAVITWVVIQLRRGEASEEEARRRLAALEREEEELKKAA